MRALERVVRLRYAVVAAAFLLFALVGSQDDGDLEFFTQGWAVLGRGGAAGGLHLYAVRPDIQIGPLALGGLWLLDALFAGRLVLAVVAAALVLLLATVRAVERLVLAEGVDPARAGLAVAVGGTALAASWAVVVPGWGHVEDLGALAALATALGLARSGHGLRCGLLLAVAVGCKPWGAFGVAILLFLPPGRRGRGVAAFAGGVAACWLPFVLAAPTTPTALGRFHIPAIWGSLPFALGERMAPGWERPGQLVLATVLIAACWRARRPDLALLVLAVARLLLDAGVFDYYDVELVLGCLVVDVAAAGSHRRLVGALAPLTVLAWVAVFVLHTAPFGPRATLAARVAAYAVLLGLAVARGRPRAAAPRTSVPRTSVPRTAESGSTQSEPAPTPQPSGTFARAEGGPVGRARALAAARRDAP